MRSCQQAQTAEDHIAMDPAQLAIAGQMSTCIRDAPAARRKEVNIDNGWVENVAGLPTENDCRSAHGSGFDTQGEAPA